jgi:hypothetical protein
MANKSIKEKAAIKQEEIVSTTTSKSKTERPLEGFYFSKDNYIFMGIGLVLIFVGFILMAGGKSADPNVFNGEELYSFRRITLAPILVLLGFAVEGYAILKKPSTK